MNIKELELILSNVKDNRLSVKDATDKLKKLPFDDSLSFATIDTHRQLRRGVPEVIYGEGKSLKQIKDIAMNMTKRKENVLVTRLDDKKGLSLIKAFKNASFSKVAKTLFIKNEKVENLGRGNILIISAGTSDIPVAEEAYICAKAMGNKVDKIYDVGVSGLHRLLHKKDKIMDANVLIVVAGMEGALPSVVAGLVDRPVIAVPTSVGYGANLGGLTTLMAMLTSCAGGISVVNIDNGFGAANMASLINR